MKSLRLKLISLIAMVYLVLGLVVVGIYAAEIQYINLSGNLTFNVDDKSLYVQDVRVQEDMDSSTTPYSLKQHGKFIPGYINGSFSMNLGTFTNDYGGDGEIEVQAVVDNDEGYIPFGSITPSEITSTTSPTATVILTITSSQGIEVDLSQITITITRREPVEITDFTFSLSDDYTASVTGHAGSDTTVTIPSSISVVETADGTKYYEGSQYTVTSIAGPDSWSGAFQSNTAITQVIFPDALQTIRDYAFYSCNNIETLEYQGSLGEYLSIDMGYNWITDNSHTLKIGGELVTDVVIPDTITTIPQYAFYSCTGIASVLIPNSVTSIEWSAFCSCYNIETIEYQGTLEEYLSIDMGNVWITDSSHSLKIGGQEITNNLVIPDTITTIPERAFCGCTDITSVFIPESVTSIGSYAFMYCTSLATVNFGDNSQLTSIGDYVFYSCTSLTKIIIPSSVTSIGNYAFSNCSSLTTVTIESETIYNSATWASACGNLLRYATTVRVLTDFVSDSHSYINTTNFPYTNDEVVGEKTYRVYSTEPLG